jgi:protein-disulfide isomerase
MANDPKISQSSLFRALRTPALILGGLILIALAVLAFGDKLTGGSDPSSRMDGMISPELLARFESEYDAEGISLGDPGAPVVVREFADYQCPACGAFALIAKKLREEYVAAGKVRFVFFDFPLPMHQHAREAASAARCAARADRFWAYHDKLFETQRDWAQTADATGFFYDLAVQTEAPLESFQRCLSQGATDALVERNVKIAGEVGAVATPTVLVGERVFSGVTGYKALTAEIDNRLATAASE